MRVDTDSVASCLSDSVFLTSAGCELTELKASVGFSSFSRFSDVGTVRAEISKYNTLPFLSFPAHFVGNLHSCAAGGEIKGVSACMNS